MTRTADPGSTANDDFGLKSTPDVPESTPFGWPRSESPIHHPIEAGYGFLAMRMSEGFTSSLKKGFSSSL